MYVFRWDQNVNHWGICITRMGHFYLKHDAKGTRELSLVDVEQLKVVEGKNISFSCTQKKTTSEPQLSIFENIFVNQV